jgi:hypothetical protein
MASISIRIPEDVIEDLKEVAPLLGFAGYQSLVRAYIGQGLRKDLARLENSPLKRVADSLRHQGVDDEIIAEAIARAQFSEVPYPQGASSTIEHACEPAEGFGLAAEVRKPLA